MKKIICLSVFVFAVLISLNSNSYSKLNASVIINSDSAEYCIVSGEVIEGDGVSYTYLNKEVKFCCEGCEKSFKKNPEKYLGAAALWCPVCNEGDAKKSISSVNDGVKYYYCSESCKTKFSENPETYLNEYKK